MIDLLKNKKIVHSFILWLISVGLFDSIFILKKSNESVTDAEFLFLAIVVIGGIITFLIFILTLEKIFHQKYPSVKASVFSILSFVFFIILGIGLIISPFILLEKYKNKEIIKPTEASKNTLITAGLKIGSTGEDVKVLQSALGTDKSIYPSGIVSGYYGELTKQAVVNFQQKYNLSQTGEIDQQTADKFNEVYGDKTREYYLSKINPKNNFSLNNNSNPVNINNNLNDPDPLVNCLIHENCGGGSRLLKKSICDQSICCQIGNSWIFYENKLKCTQDQNNFKTQQINSPNKIPVFLSYSGYTRYCPPQNIDAIKSIDETMVNKKNEWAKEYQECINSYNQTDPCKKSCNNKMESESWDCIQLYENKNDPNYQSCQNKVSENYISCTNNCQNPYIFCESAYSEANSLTQEINNLCK